MREYRMRGGRRTELLNIAQTRGARTNSSYPLPAASSTAPRNQPAISSSHSSLRKPCSAAAIRKPKPLRDCSFRLIATASRLRRGVSLSARSGSAAGPPPWVPNMGRFSGSVSASLRAKRSYLRDHTDAPAVDELQASGGTPCGLGQTALCGSARTRPVTSGERVRRMAAACFAARSSEMGVPSSERRVWARGHVAFSHSGQSVLLRPPWAAS
jgi:hypothetical protein